MKGLLERHKEARRVCASVLLMQRLQFALRRQLISRVSGVSDATPKRFEANISSCLPFAGKEP